jgi:osmotically-inducible protein OsmY
VAGLIAGILLILVLQPRAPRGREETLQLLESVRREKELRATEPGWVYVKVEDGILALFGTVPNWTSYEATSEVVQHSAGVVEIQDCLNMG